MNSVICEAIRARALLMFGYGDYIRVVEPHIYGLNTAGNQALSAWLRPGNSRTDPDGGWRMFRVEDMRNLQQLPEGFLHPREGYNPDDPHIVTAYCRIELAGAGAATTGAGAPQARGDVPNDEVN